MLVLRAPHDLREGRAAYALACDDDLRDGEIGREVEHRSLERSLAYRAQTTGARSASDGLAGDLPKRLLFELQLHALNLEHTPVLLYEGVLGRDENLHEVVLGELSGGCDNGNTAEKLGNHTELMQVLRHVDAAVHRLATELGAVPARAVALGRVDEKGDLALHDHE